MTCLAQGGVTSDPTLQYPPPNPIGRIPHRTLGRIPHRPVDIEDGEGEVGLGRLRVAFEHLGLLPALEAPHPREGHTTGAALQRLRRVEVYSWKLGWL